MIGELSPPEVENLLHNEVIAGLAVTPRAIPTSCRSPTHMMGRRSSDIEAHDDAGESKGVRGGRSYRRPLDCRSVIAHGTFEELSGPAAEEAVRRTSARFASRRVSVTAKTSCGLDPHSRSLGRMRFSTYRTKTGWFEQE